MTLFRILLLGFALLLLSSTALGSKNDDALSALVEQARQLSDIRAEGAPPFRLQMDFKVIGRDGTARQGVYTEVWVSKTQWRKEIAVGDFRRIQVAVGRKLLRLDNSMVIPEGAESIPSLSAFPKFPEEWKWKSSKDRDVNGVTVRCLEPKVKNRKETYCFDKIKGTLAIEDYVPVIDSRILKEEERICSYSDYQKFGDRLFATSYECNDKHFTRRAKIVELAAAPSIDSTLFEKPEGAKESVNCLDSIKQPKQLYAPEPHTDEVYRGTIRVSVRADIGTDGKPHNQRVISEPRPAFDNAALAALQHWKFKPASCGGEPIEAEIAVEFEFKRY